MQADCCILRGIFGPGFPDFRPSQYHIFHVIFDVLAGVLCQRGAEIGQHLRCDKAPQSRQVLFAPGCLNVGQQLLEGRLVCGCHVAYYGCGPSGRGRGLCQQGPADGAAPRDPGKIRDSRPPDF